MHDYLVFQLYGPIASWGNIAVGETRPSALVPARSAILGLIAAAIGIKRPDTVQEDAVRTDLEAGHAALEKGYGLAFKLEALGDPLIDYHTSEVPSSTGFITRRKEIVEVARQKRRGKFKGTILSRREYRQDAWVVCAVWLRPGAPYPLQEICNRLNTPHFVLYLGRKSCPPSLPLSAKVIHHCPWVEDALKEHSLSDTVNRLWPENPEEVRRLMKNMRTGSVLMAWDIDAETQMAYSETISRRDASLSRRRWQFVVRSEHRMLFPAEVST